MDKLPTSPSPNVFCLSTGYLDKKSVEAIIADFRKDLETNHGLPRNSNASEKVSIIHRAGPDTIESRYGMAVIHSNDRKFVNACMGRNFDGSPRVRPVVNNSGNSTPTSSTSSLHLKDEFVPKSGRSWADSLDDDDDIFAQPPPALNDEDQEQSKKTTAPPQVFAPKVQVEYEPMPSMVQLYIKEYPAEIVNHLKARSPEKEVQTYVEVRVCDTDERPSDNKYCDHVLSTTFLSEEITPEDIVREFSRFNSTPGLVDQVRIGKNKKQVTYPYAWVIHPRMKDGPKRTMLVMFNPRNPRDAKDALLIYRQLAITKNGKECYASFANAFTSWV